MRLKILHITAHMGAGAGKAISGIAVNDDVNNHEIVLLQPPQKSNHIEKCRKQGIEVSICPEAELLKKKILEADVVVVSWWHHPAIYDVLCRFQRLQARLVIWNHINGLAYPRLSYEVLNSFDACMFTSKASYINTYWTQNQRISLEEKSRVVFGMGDFRPEEYEAKSEYCIGDKINIGYVGSLDYAKLNSCIVDWMKYAATADNRVVFSIAGDCLPEIKKDIEKSGLSDKVSLLGFRNDIPQLLRSFDLFVYPLNPSNFATTENSVIEAMAVGLPIITSKGTVEQSILTDGINGLLVANYEEFKDAFEKMIRNKEIRKKLGKRAREDAIRTYSISNNMESFYHVIEIAMKTDKHEHSFTNVFGNSAHEWFLCGCDAEEKKILERGMRADLNSGNDLLKLGKIFWGNNKGSVNQFNSYDKNDYYLKRLLENMEMERNVYESKDRN